MNPKRKRQMKADAEGIGCTGFVGIGLVAGGLWNIPVFFHLPQSREGWMMWGLVLLMIAAGVLLLILPRPGSGDDDE